MNENEWRQLVKNALNNDEAAFDRLYKETERSVYFLCLKLLGNEQDAKDAAQETYLAAFNGLSTLDDGANFPKWINGIAVNQCKRFFRTPKNESLDEKIEHGVEFSDDENFIPDDYVTDAEKRRLIMKMIDTELSEVQRQTVILYYYNGLKTNEIASIMDCPEGTVTYRLSAAREKIREAVLIYEKENKERLHAIVPIPILTLILRSEAERTVVPDIRLFKNPAASAKHLKAGGKAIMKNALTGKVMAAAAAVVVVGGGITAAIALNRNNDSNIIDNDSYVSGRDSESDNVVSTTTDIDGSTADAQTSEDDSTPEETTEAEELLSEFLGFRVHVPAGFQKGEAYDMYSKIMSDESQVVLDWTTYTGAYNSNIELQEMSLDEEVEFFESVLRWHIDTYYEIYSASYEMIEDEKEETTILNLPAYKISGQITGSKEEKELVYTAYYAMVPVNDYDGAIIPFCWLAFAEDTEENRAEMESALQIFAEQTEQYR